MSECNSGSLSTIRNPVTPDECGCDCSPADIIYTGEAFECNGVVPNERLDSVLNKILTKLCDIDTEITVTDIVFDCLNGLPSPTSGGLTETLQFFADNTLFRGGNTCECPVTDDIFFAQDKGVAGCDNGSITFETDYVNIASDVQVRVVSDLKLSNGFSAGYGSTSSSLDLGSINLLQLDYTYGVDCTGGSRTITLPQIAAASLNHKNRRFGIRRVDCVVANTGTIQAYAGETIEGAASITLPIGHAFILQANDSTNDWVVVAEYFGCDTVEVQNDGDVYMAYNLGVGDSSPDAKLDVVQSDATLVTAIIENSGSASADLLRINRNGSTIDVFDEAGRLQVGGSNPAAMLHVVGEGASSATKSFLVENSNSLDMMWIENDGVTVIRTNTDKRFNFDVGGNLNIINDSGVVRSFELTSSYMQLDYTLIKTSNITLTPTSSVGSIFFDLVYAGTGNSGLNSLIGINIEPTFNLTGTALGDTYGVLYSPTFTSTGGNNFGVVVDNANTLSGFGIAAPVSTLETGGSFGTAIRTITGITSADVTDHTILADTTSGSYTLTLPAANTCEGRIYIVKKISNDANVLTISPNADGASKTITTQYAFYALQSDGSAYYVIGNN